MDLNDGGGGLRSGGSAVVGWWWRQCCWGGARTTMRNLNSERAKITTVTGPNRGKISSTKGEGISLRNSPAAALKSH